MSHTHTITPARKDALDSAALDQALRVDEEPLPADLVRRMVASESPIRVFRTYRGLTQQVLADATNVPKTTINELETGRKDGSIKTLSRIAEVLNVDVDDLI
ncbi:MAG: helix-turn-helix domain-containing protein [Robiginitomaculum sp.]|nr:helix-turn-helix domain-containing protein [Robiginitomaculum sp.]